MGRFFGKNLSQFFALRRAGRLNDSFDSSYRTQKNGACRCSQKKDHQETAPRRSPPPGFEKIPPSKSCAIVNPVVSGPLRIREPSPPARHPELQRLAHVPFQRGAGGDAFAQRGSAKAEFHLRTLIFMLHQIRPERPLLGLTAIVFTCRLISSIAIPSTATIFSRAFSPRRMAI